MTVFARTETIHLVCGVWLADSARTYPKPFGGVQWLVRTVRYFFALPALLNAVLTFLNSAHIFFILEEVSLSTPKKLKFSRGQSLEKRGNRPDIGTQITRRSPQKCVPISQQEIIQPKDVDVKNHKMIVLSEKIALRPAKAQDTFPPHTNPNVLLTLFTLAAFELYLGYNPYFLRQNTLTNR